MNSFLPVRGLAVPANALMLAAGTVVLMACALTACSTTPHKSAEQRLADADTASRVQAALLADPDLYARHIDVEVERGVVHLGGYVWEAEDFKTARRDAASVAGANAVVSDMELVRGGLAGTGR